MQYGVNPKLATYVHQEHLLNTIRDLFPNATTEVNTKDVLEAPGRTVMEFDMFLPELSLCFEFQDSYHYVTTWYNQKALQTVVQSDESKASSALRNNMSMVVVPCWWDGKPESLAATIQFVRPDMPFHDFHKIIPLNPPRGFFLSSDLPNVGELMLASFSQDVQEDIKPKNWWMGEKYDGIRFCWNPLDATLYTRSGRHIPFPAHMTKRLPKHFMDGEFWFGRGSFAEACLLVTGSPEHLEAQYLRLMVFDNPLNKTQKLPFEERYKSLIQIIFPGHPFIQVAQRVLCQSYTHLMWSVHSVVDDGGEGMILRKIKSKYEHGRTSNLLKIKMSKSDREAIVMEKRAADNSLVLALPNGRIVHVPSTHIHVPLPDPGAIVSYFFESFSRTRDVPLHPQVYRVRSDISWQEVMSSVASEEKQEKEVKQKLEIEANTTNMRLFFEDFAKTRNLDPHKPETWYSIPYKVFYANKGARAVLQKFKGGYYKALLHVFPDIGLQAETFNMILWTDPDNRRRFFEMYARQHRFDPLVADNWYTQQREQITAMKGANRVLSYYNHSVAQALLELFPDIGIDLQKFQPSYWFRDSRAKFFLRFAKREGFDPLVAENWYKIPKEQLEAEINADMVSKYYKNDVHRALEDLLPESNFVRPRVRKNSTSLSHLRLPSSSNSNNRPINILITPDKRRKVLEDFAQQSGFDPLFPDFWYGQSRDKLFSIKGAAALLHYHGYSWAKALIELFPEVQFDSAKFGLLSLWGSSKVRRRFFEEFAVKEGFDPLVPENWYRYPLEQIMGSSAMRVAKYHQNDLRVALQELFPEITFDINKLFNTTDKTVLTRRFFDRYAAKYNFNPQEPTNWYKQPYNLIAAEPDFTVVSYYSSIARALMVSYPNIGLQTNEFLLQHAQRDSGKMKQFFDSYAAAHDFDPLVATNWYKQAAVKILNFKGASSVMAFFNNRVVQALQHTYPDIGLDRERFKTQLEYRDPKMRRLFFEKYAKEHDFDPLEPHSWYIQPTARISATKGASRVLQFYHNIPKALMDLFPEIGLEKRGFQDKFVFKDSGLRRKFFEGFARRNMFDPLVPENWYNVRRDQIHKVAGGSAVLYYHQSYAHALVELFPEIGLELNSFPTAFARDQRKPAGEATLQAPSGGTLFTRRSFFETYAKDHGFDPLDAEAWYQQPIPRIMATKGASKIVLKHGSIKRGLMDLFPDVVFHLPAFKQRLRS